LNFLAGRYGLVQDQAKGRCFVLKYLIRERLKVKDEIKVKVNSIYSDKKN
jgi:hypothetical protein